MSRVVLAAADEELALRVKHAADGDVHVLPPGRLPSDPFRLFEQLLDAELPDVMVIGPDAPVQEALSLAERLDVQCPGISVVLVAVPSPELWQAAMRSGVRDLIPPDLDPMTMRAALDRAAQLASGRRRVLRPAEETARYTGRVITVASPKGGVGKTTVATNLAIGLTSSAPQSTSRRSSPSTPAACSRCAGRRTPPRATPSPARTSAGCSRRCRGSSATSSSTPPRG